MVRWVANLTMLFTEVPFMERFERAARVGFRYVEYLFPYGLDVDAVAAELKRNGWSRCCSTCIAGERGIANDPGRRAAFREGVEQAVDIARRLGVQRLNCLVGLRLRDVPEIEQHACLVDNLRHAADRLAAHGITLLVEPLNVLDVPGFYLTTTWQALALLDEVGRPNVRIQYDAYHMQLMEGNLTHTLRTHLARIGHVQVADVPGRHQPGTGEIHYPFVLRALDDVGYEGFVSLEYVPQGSTEESLRQAAAAGLAELGLPHPL